MTITITEFVPPYLKDYLRNYCYVKNRQWYINRKNDVGRYFFSLLREPKYEEIKEAMRNDGLRLVVGRGYYRNQNFSDNFIPVKSQKKFIDWLSVTFNFEFHEWCMVSQSMGISLTTSIHMFMRAKNISDTSANYESLKKKNQRRMDEIRQKVSNIIEVAVNQ